MRHRPRIVPLLLLGSALAQTPTAPARTLVFEEAAQTGRWFARANGVGYRFEGARTVAVADDGEVAITMVGAAEVPLVPAQRAPGVSNYYVGNDPRHFRVGVPHWRELRAHRARPGVDLVHRASGADLEFDVVCAPGIDPAGIAFDLDGGGAPRLTDDGAIAVMLGARELLLHAPVVYQDDHGHRREIACHYVLDGRRLRFAVGDHDATLALVIDPVVTFSTMLGGSLGQEVVSGVHLSQQHEVVVTGRTQASNFPLFHNLPYTYRFDLGFVTKFDAQGQLVFSTFFGGTTGTCAPVDIGTDVNGQIVFGGNTTSPDLPTTSGVVQPTLVGGGDWFFTDLDAGGQLLWCTYFGGPGNQQNMKCLHVLDVQFGSVLGVGLESAFPFEPNAYSTQGPIVCGGVYAGNVVWCASACGFSGTPTAVDVTSQGHICITGSIVGSNPGLPTTGASYQPNSASPSSFDGFVFVFTGQQNSLVYATYLGGSLSDIPRGIAASTAPGSVVVTVCGETLSSDFPLHNAAQPTAAAGQNGFVAQIDGLTQTLNFASYLGGTDPGETYARCGIDQNGFVVVAGTGNSANLPYRNPLKYANTFSNRDAVIYRFTPTGALDFCTDFGGNGAELLTDLSVAQNGDFAIAGQVAASNWPSSVNALPPAFVDQDAFVAVFDPRSIVSYGTGTPGSGTYVPVLAGGGPTAPGATTSLQVHDGLSLAVGVIGSGLGRTNIPAFGGAILTNALALQVIVLQGLASGPIYGIRGGGYLHTSFPIPNQPWVSGITIDFQAAFLDPLANGGVSLTNGVELVIQ